MNKVYHQVDSIVGSVITLRAEGVACRELAEITPSFPRKQENTGTQMKKLLAFTALAALVSPLTHSANAAVIHVNHAANGANNGTSWPNAFTSLQSALDAAQPGDEIRVAQGTYYPSKDASNDGITYNVTIPNGVTTDRHKAFVLKKDVALLGGFNAATGARDRALHTTVLSGDIGAPGDDSDNCYHVVISAGDVGDALLDGFTITKGVASTTWNENIMVNDVISPYGTRLSARGSAGAGIMGLCSSPTIANCVITGNKAPGSGTPGGVTTVSGEGGGAYFIYGSPTIVNCAFTGNAGAWGAALTALSAYSGRVTDCVFTDNTVLANAATYVCVAEFNGITLTRCAFTNNHVMQQFSSWQSATVRVAGDTVFANCLIKGEYFPGANQAALHVNGGGSIFANCVIDGYITPNSKGHAYLANTIFVGDLAFATHRVLMRNSLHSANLSTAATYYNDAGAAAATGMAPNAFLRDPANGDYRLNDIPGNPAINTGMSPVPGFDEIVTNIQGNGTDHFVTPGVALSATDLDGAPRVSGAGVDLGPYELQSPVNDGACTVAPAPVVFPAVAESAFPPPAQTLTLTNGRGVPLTGLKARISQGEAFEVTAPLSSASVAPGATATLAVRPLPGRAKGVHTGELLITGDSGVRIAVPLAFAVGAEIPPPVITEFEIVRVKAENCLPGFPYTLIGAPGLGMPFAELLHCGVPAKSSGTVEINTPKPPNTSFFFQLAPAR